jgi:hypothetical protein
MFIIWGVLYTVAARTRENEDLVRRNAMCIYRHRNHEFFVSVPIYNMCRPKKLSATPEFMSSHKFVMLWYASDTTPPSSEAACRQLRRNGEC